MVAQCDDIVLLGLADKRRRALLRYVVVAFHGRNVLVIGYALRPFLRKQVNGELGQVALSVLHVLLVQVIKDDEADGYYDNQPDNDGFCCHNSRCFIKNYVLLQIYNESIFLQNKKRFIFSFCRIFAKKVVFWS